MAKKVTNKEIKEVEKADAVAVDTKTDIEITETTEKETVKETVSTGSLYYRGVKIISEVEDKEVNGHIYKSFTTEDKCTLLLAPQEFDAEVTNE